jgi:hypothetical protein
VVETKSPTESPYVAAPIVTPVMVMLTVELAAIFEPLDKTKTMLVDVGASQVANPAELFIETLGVAEIAKKPLG